MNNKKCIIDFSAIKTFDYYSKTIEIILEDYTPLFILDGKKILTYENSLEEKIINEVRNKVCNYLSNILFTTMQYTSSLLCSSKSKLLKISSSCEVSTYLLYSTKLVMLEALDSFIGWRMNNFIDIKMYYNPNYINYFFFEEELDEAISIERKTYNDLNEYDNIIDFTKKEIDEDYFVDIHLDEFFLENKDFYKKDHFVHESLIYGYDDIEKKFYAYGFVKNQSIEKFCIPYDDYQLAYENSKIFYWKGANYLFYDYPYPIDVRKVNHGCAKTFNLKDFINRLKCYVYPDMDEIVESDVHIYGNNVCKYVADCIIEGKKFIDFRCINLLYEHKLCLKNRFYYIMCKFDVEKELHDECVEFETIYSAYRRLRLLFLKQLIKEKKDSFILAKPISDKNTRESIGTELYMLYNKEKNILAKLIKKLERIGNAK